MLDASLLSLLPLLLAAGAFAGFTAGLFGIGGGVVVVPTLYYLLLEVGPEGGPHMKVAVATSLATIVVTSIASLRAHHKRGGVDADVFRRWKWWIVLGAVIGVSTARFVSGTVLVAFFGAAALVFALLTVLSEDVKARLRIQTTHAGERGMAAGLGFVSSWLGMGGGVFGVVLLTMTGVPVRKAVGTAAGFGVAVGLPGALGAMVLGIGEPNLPPYSLGYVSIPAFLAITTMTVLTANLGARVAHGIPERVLSLAFAVGLALIGLRMLWTGLEALVLV